MPQIILGPQQYAPNVDAPVRAKAYTFMAKLAENDALPGLHIEPITHAADSRVRTGRVDQFWRAVMFKVQGQGQEALYVYLGVWPHDDAATFAMRAKLTVNPVNGIAELLLADPAEPMPAAPYEPVHAATVVDEPAEPLFVRLGLDAEALVEELGLDAELVALALEAKDEDEILTLAEIALDWQGVALIDLSAGKSIETVKETLGIGASSEPVPTDDPDAELAAALKHPAARLQFAFLEDNDELRRAIEDGDFAAWRVFLHPEQRKWVDKRLNGPFRLSGGAGTGKTVVLLHRARHLAKANPDARILLTTFNKTLADSLLRDLKMLDPSLPIAERIDEPGIYVRGIDAAVRAVLQANAHAVPDVISKVLGHRTSEIGRITDRHAWRDAISSDGSDLAEPLKTAAFMHAEYSVVVLPNRALTVDDYVKVRRLGRGVALDRSSRIAVWAVVSAYRLNAGIRGSIDFAESAALATEILNATNVRPFDHVLVDEGQDLSPTHWQFLRALAGEGPDDLFIAEDSHQRIYGHKITLSRYGIKIIGRSQRLRLNYRTTAQNLRYAVSVLTGTAFVDLEDEAEEASDYRSARTGPTPRMIAASSLADEFERAAETIGAWLKEDSAPETIGVLVRTEQAGEQLVRALEERGVQTRFVSDKSVPSGKPVVMTMHRAKGMEFERVIIFGADATALPAPFALKGLPEGELADARQREKSLLYVAATRARDELVILWDGEPSELLPATGEADA